MEVTTDGVTPPEWEGRKEGERIRGTGKGRSDRGGGRYGECLPTPPPPFTPLGPTTILTFHFPGTPSIQPFPNPAYPQFLTLTLEGSRLGGRG